MGRSISTWVPVHFGLYAHPKTKRLARCLGVDAFTAASHMVALWSWAMEYAPSGDLSHLDPEEVEDGAFWQGDPGIFREAAMAAGFIDARGWLHEWSLYGGALLEQRAKGRAKKAAQRGRQKAAGALVGDACPRDVPATSPGRPRIEGKGCEETGSEEDSRSPSSARAADGASSVKDTTDDGFDAFWAAYPRPVGKTEAQRRWKRLSASERGDATAAAANLTANAIATGRDSKFIPYPSTFIGPQRQWEDWVNGSPAGYDSTKASKKASVCPNDEMDLTWDEIGPHCPVCGWRPTAGGEGDGATVPPPSPAARREPSMRAGPPPRLKTFDEAVNDNGAACSGVR